MTELKTLKDLMKIRQSEKYKCQEYYLIPEDLKAEAVKDIKSIKKSLLIGDLLKEQAGQNAFNDIEKQEKAVIEYIKWKFNLTEEDLNPLYESNKKREFLMKEEELKEQGK